MRRIHLAILITGIVVLGTSAGASLFADIDPTIPTAASIEATTTEATAVTIMLSGASNDAGSITFATTTSPAHGTLGVISGAEVLYTPASDYTGSDSFEFVAIEGATSSAQATVSIMIDALAPATGTAHITLRDGPSIATSTTISFPLSGTTPIATTLGDTHDVPVDSVLAALVALDASSSEFEISDLQFNAGYGAFYLRCLSVPAATSSAECDNWQYTVNGTGPNASMDQYELHDGDTIYVYFGYPRIVELSAPTTTVGTPVTATVKQYDPATGTYEATTGYTIGATQPDPANPWNPFEIATSSVDGAGHAILTLTATGTYDIGIAEDFYFPTIALTVMDAPSGTGGGGGSGTFSGGSDPYAATGFDIPKALAYLSAQQNPDGSIGSTLVTDWAALAFADHPGTTRDKLKSYLLSSNPAPASITDHERHAMALAALGISPYDGTATDLVAAVLAGFDGTQVGDTSLITDDIFAIFPLTHSGYTQFDDVVRRIATRIIAAQKPDGSWEGSVDVTAAAMQALGPLYTIPGYGAALGKGAGYLASTQKTDGGWDNVDSTSWVMTMVNSVKEGDPSRAPVLVSSSGKKPEDAIFSYQQSDGGVRNVSEPASTRLWSTAYAIVAASGKSWISLMNDFTKPAGSTSFSGGSDPYATSTDATATSTAMIATSTPETATTSDIDTPATTTHAIVPTLTAFATTSGPKVATSAAEKKPAPKPKAVARASSATESAPSAGETLAPETQAAIVATARPSIFSRVIGWFKHLFHW